MRFQFGAAADLTPMSLNTQLLTLRSVIVAMAGVQLATAASGTLVPLVFSEIGASQEAVSFAASAYSAGFLVGCFFVAKFIGDIGHIRAFAAAAAITTLAALLFSLVSLTPALILLRLLTGLATAGLFAIGDAWINETAEESTRGRVLSIYAIIIGLVSVGSQVFVVLTPDDVSKTFVFVAVIYCFIIIVIAITRSNPPETGSRADVRVAQLMKNAPAAALGIFAMGFVSTNILSVAPYGAAQLGVETQDIALMIGAIYLGRVLFQYPLGVLSDRIDRRIVILITSLISVVVLVLMTILSDPKYADEPFDYLSFEFGVLIVLLLAFGGSLLALYSLLVSHALDRSEVTQFSSTAVTMLFVWTIASVVGPIVVNGFTIVLGDNALFWVNLVVMLSYTIFLAIRIVFIEPVSDGERITHVDVVPTSTELAQTDLDAAQ
ncbi:MFS family permease [Labrenzia sp. EL_126]|nr:MFS family permease [Labrenzia sp. EL_126]